MKTDDIFLDGSKVKALREALGYTQAKLAELCVVSRTQITMIEANKTDGSLHMLYALATVLQTTSDYLIGLSNNPGARWEQRIEKVKKLVLVNRTDC